LVYETGESEGLNIRIAGDALYIEPEPNWNGLDNEDWELDLQSPMGVCLMEMGDSETEDDNLLLIADSGNNRILIVDFEGEIIGEYSDDQSPYMLNWPYDVEWSSDEMENSEIIYVIDGGNRRTLKLSGPLNSLEYQYCVYNDIIGLNPTRMALDVNSHLYVVDKYNSRVFKYKDCQNSFIELDNIGGQGHSHGGMYFPTSITIPRPYHYAIVSEFYSDFSGAVLFKIDLKIVFESINSYIIDPSVAEFIELEYKLTDYASDLIATVVNTNEQVVRTLEDQESKESGVYSIIWDGKDSQGQILPEGEYMISIAANDVYDEPNGGVDVYDTPPLLVPIEIRPKEVHISVNTTWNSERVIHRNLIIDQGASLTLIPGARLLCRPGSAIYINGRLDVQGELQNRIYIGSIGAFGPLEPVWEGIIINAPEVNNSSFSYCQIQGAEAGLNINQPGIESNVIIEHTMIRNCSFGLYLFKSKGTVVSNSSITACGTGIYIDGNSNLQLSSVVVTNSQQDGIYLHQSNLTMNNSEIHLSGGAGIDLISAFDVSIFDSRVQRNGLVHSMGLGVFMSSSSPSFYHTTIENNMGFGVYISNNSFPIFYDILNPLEGYNTLLNNGFDEMVYVGGMAFISNTHNNFMDDEDGVLLRTYNSPHFWGEENVIGNYWGHFDGPHFGQLLPDGYFMFSPYDEEFNEPGQLLMSLDDYEELQVIYNRALIASMEGDTAVACRAFRDLINRVPDAGFASSATIKYANLFANLSFDNNDGGRVLEGARSYFSNLQEDRRNRNLVFCPIND